jgi:hypothetical protein
MTLEAGDCILRFTHTYGMPTGQMDAITFTPEAGSL